MEPGPRELKERPKLDAASNEYFPPMRGIQSGISYDNLIGISGNEKEAV